VAQTTMTLAPNNNNVLHATLRTYREEDQPAGRDWLESLLLRPAPKRRVPLRQRTGDAPLIETTQQRRTLSSIYPGIPHARSDGQKSTMHFEQGHWKSTEIAEIPRMSSIERRRRRLMWKHNRGCQYENRTRPSTAPAARHNPSSAPSKPRQALVCDGLSEPSVKGAGGLKPSVTSKLTLPRAQTSLGRPRDLNQIDVNQVTARSKQSTHRTLATLTNRSGVKTVRSRTSARKERPQTAKSFLSRSEQSVCGGLGLTYD